MTTLLTIGLPVYNSMPYLREAVESLLGQTVSNFKILAIVQDCPDGSLEYLRSVRDPRLRIIRQPKASLIHALNRMLREIDTPWLVRQDTDDISYPTRVERVLEHINLFPNAGMFYSLADYYPKDQCLGQFRCSRGSPEELRRVVESGYLLSFCHPSVILNKEKTLGIGGYRENFYIEDTDLWWRMALAHEIRFIPEALIGYRQHSSSLTANNLRRQHVEGGLYVQYCLLSHLWSLPAEPFEQVKKELESFVRRADLDAKQHLRSVNIFLSQRKHFTAAAAAFRCWMASPRFLLKRVLDELSSSGMICNGVDPELYLQRKDEFWPSTPSPLSHLHRQHVLNTPSD
jgi:glycosyltransferase involved in cell wall biosynthesis